MTNNDFMNLLTAVSKNDTKKNQLIAMAVIVGLALTGCCLLYTKNKKNVRRYDEMKRENDADKAQLMVNSTQILHLNNTIKKLISEKEMKGNNNSDNNTSLKQKTTVA